MRHHMLVFVLSSLALAVAEYLVPETKEMKELLMSLGKSSDPFALSSFTYADLLKTEKSDEKNDKDKRQPEELEKKNGQKDEDNKEKNNDKKPLSKNNSDTKGSMETIKNDAINAVKGMTEKANKSLKGKDKKGSSDTNNDQELLDSIIDANSGNLPVSGLAKESKEPQVFWANVNINDSVQRVQVSVKTVTVIDTVEGDGSQKGSPKKGKEPFIRIQLPSQMKSLNDNNSSKKSSPIKSATNEAKSAVTSALPPAATSIPEKVKSIVQNKNDDDKKEAGDASKKDVKKSTEDKKADEKKKEEKKEGEEKKEAEEKKKKEAEDKKKKEAEEKKKEKKEAEDKKKKEAEEKKEKSGGTKDDKKPSEKSKEDAAIGDIIDILKNIPKIKGGSDETYLEGKFKFPKIKELKSREFKITGYLSS